MSKQCLNMLTFHTLLHQMCCEAMTETVRGCIHRKVGIGYGTAHHLLQCTDCQVITGEFIRKQDSTRPSFLKPVLCKDIQTTLGKDCITIHPVLSISDMYLHI